MAAMEFMEMVRFAGQIARQAITGNKGKMLEPGSIAPDFQLSDESGNLHSLSQYRGRKVVLWFFPKADTPG
jgi:peroxiredoxin